MIIFGTRGITRKTSEGAFFCPKCERREHFQQKTVRRFFALYFIPIIPLDRLADFVECQSCQTTYEPAVLEYDPEEATAKARAEWERAMTSIMIRVLLADGRVDDGEVQTVRNIYEQLTDRPLSEADVLTEIASVEARGGSIKGDLERFTPMLNEHGKEMVVRAALAVAASDGEVQDEEKKLISDIAKFLQMSQAHFQGILMSGSDRSEANHGDTP